MRNVFRLFTGLFILLAGFLNRMYSRETFPEDIFILVPGSFFQEDQAERLEKLHAALSNTLIRSGDSVFLVDYTEEAHLREHKQRLRQSFLPREWFTASEPTLSVEAPYNYRTALQWTLDRLREEYRSRSSLIVLLTESASNNYVTNSSVSDLVSNLVLMGASFIILEYGEKEVAQGLLSDFSHYTMLYHISNETVPKLQQLVKIEDYIEIGNVNLPGNFKNEGSLKLVFFSHFDEEIELTLRGVYLRDIQWRGTNIMETSPNLLPETLDVSLRSGEITNLELALAGVADLKRGYYQASLLLVGDGEWNWMPAMVPVRFQKGRLWWLFFLFLGLALFFKSYIRDVLLKIDRSKIGGKLFFPFKQWGKRLKYRMEKFTRTHLKLLSFFESVSLGIDSAAAWTVDRIKVLFSVIGHALKATGIFMLKILSRYLLFFPLGFILKKSGEGLTGLDRKIQGLEIKPRRHRAHLKLDRKKYPRMRV